jgi:hypothetical protein
MIILMMHMNRVVVLTGAPAGPVTSYDNAKEIAPLNPAHL